MKPDPKIFDDLARMAGGAVNLFSGLQQQIREEIRSRVDEMLARLDVVPREDFERLEGMVAKLRQRQEELESRFGDKPATPQKTAVKPALEKTSKGTAKKSPARPSTGKTAQKTATKKKK